MKSKKIVILLIFTLFLFTIPNIQGLETEVSSVSTDKLTYELGEEVNLTVSFFVEFDERSGYGYCQTKLRNNQTGILLNQHTWSTLISEYPYTENWVFNLDPENWNPGNTSKKGIITVEAIAYDISGGYITNRTTNITIIKADQNITYYFPSTLLDNDTIDFSAELFNEHNTIFPVKNRNVTWQIIKNNITILTQNNETNNNGTLFFSFNPVLYGHGNYTLKINGSSNEKYEKISFDSVFSVLDHTLNNSSQPNSTQVNIITDIQDEIEYSDPLEINVNISSVQGMISFPNISLLIFDGVNWAFLANKTGDINGILNCQIPLNQSPGNYSLCTRFNGVGYYSTSNVTESLNITKINTEFQITGNITPLFLENIPLEITLFNSKNMSYDSEWITIFEIVDNVTMKFHFIQLDNNGTTRITVYCDTNILIKINYDGTDFFDSNTQNLTIIPTKMLPNITLNRTIFTINDENQKIKFGINSENQIQIENYTIGISISSVFLGNFTSDTFGEIIFSTDLFKDISLGNHSMIIVGYGNQFFKQTNKSLNIFINQIIILNVVSWEQTSNQVIIHFNNLLENISIDIYEDSIKIGNRSLINHESSIKFNLTAGSHNLTLQTVCNLPYVGTNTSIFLEMKPPVFIQLEYPFFILPDEKKNFSLKIIDKDGYSILFGTITISIFDSEDNLIKNKTVGLSNEIMWESTQVGKYKLLVEYNDQNSYFSFAQFETNIEVRKINSTISSSLTQEHRLLVINGVLVDEFDVVLPFTQIEVFINNFLFENITTDFEGKFYFEYYLSSDNITIEFKYNGDIITTESTTEFRIQGKEYTRFSNSIINSFSSLFLLFFSIFSFIIIKIKNPKSIKEILVR
ncbi:MAG: hypothetical protein ACTSUV_06660 [Candidatus Ranarchaeia archaeon]